MKKILIYGTSSGARQVLDMLNHNRVEVINYIQTYKNEKVCYFNGKQVLVPEEILNIDYNYIIIGSSTYEDEMIEELDNLGVCREAILTPLSMLLNKKIKHYTKFHKKYILYKNVFTKEFIVPMFNDFSFSSMNSKYSKNRSIFLYDYPDYILKGIDYVRLSTVELCAKEINESKIDGAVAELGVYQGGFTKLLSSLFTNRTLYLFDTFEGFSSRDIVIEQEKEYSKAIEGHLSDTNINVVLQKINKNQKAVIVKKGYFPDTTIDMEEDVYVFVSIDVDLYKPTYDGLEYFYKRLAKGGYIIVHDYNFPTYSGVKEAVKKFSEKHNIGYVPVSDYFGSVIFTK